MLCGGEAPDGEASRIKLLQTELVFSERMNVHASIERKSFKGKTNETCAS